MYRRTGRNISGCGNEHKTDTAASKVSVIFITKRVVTLDAFINAAVERLRCMTEV